MPFITKYLFVTILLSPAMIFLGFALKSRILIISYAILNAIISSWLIADIIFSYSASEPTLEKKMNFFFSNDASMIFYLVYVPLILIGCILPIAFCLFKRVR